MDIHSRHALVGDIGGTYLSFAIADIDELTIDHFALLSAADFASPMDALKRYLESLPRWPKKASFAVAGKVEAGSARMTFRPWTITESDIRATTGAETVTLLNDVEALALALPHLTSDELVPVQAGSAAARAPKLVINAGTGLGIATLAPADDGWTVIRGQAEDMAAPALRPGEFDLHVAFAPGEFISAQALFSGAGLVRLYRALAGHYGQPAGAHSAPQVTEAARAGEDRAAAEAIRLMGIWFARFAGDVALLVGATGGVFLAGGLSANVVPLLGRDAFCKAFADKGDARASLQAMPVTVIKTGADAGLRGAAVALARQLDRQEAPARILRVG